MDKEDKRRWIELCCGTTLGDKIESLMVNTLNTLLLKKEDNQQKEEGKDGGEGSLKGADDGKLSGDKYSNERKQLILSLIESEDRVWIDKFQDGSIALGIELKNSRAQGLVTCRLKDQANILQPKAMDD